MEFRHHVDRQGDVEVAVLIHEWWMSTSWSYGYATMAPFPARSARRAARSGPQRFRTGSRTGGTGLGLTIATGQARVLGARPPDGA